MNTTTKTHQHRALFAQKATSAAGNVLFLILIAVALFAALSYAVTQSSRSSGDGGLDKDKAKLAASDLLQYAVSIEQAVNRMQVVGRVPEHGLDFSAGSNIKNTANTACTTNYCKVFHPDGGGAVARLTDEKYLDTTSPMYISSPSNARMPEVRVVSVPQVGSEADDLILFIPSLKAEICYIINEKMGILPYGTTPPQDIYGDTDLYQGNLTAFPSVTGQIDPAPMAGKRSFCIGHTNTNTIFIHVLMAR